MMNSAIASNINGGAVINQQVANGSCSSVLLSSIDFSLTEIKKNFAPNFKQEKYLIKLSGKEEILNGQHKIKICDQNKNSIENTNILEKNTEDSIPIPKVQLYTGNINTEWHQMYKIGAGLNNLGNTCFMNTVIQCLTYCPPLVNYLLHNNDHASKCTTTGFCMMCLLQKHMRRVIGKTGEVIKPIEVYQRLKVIVKHFQFGRQEDAHEFLRYVIDHLWKACFLQTNGMKLDSASKETTVINKIFGGYHRSQVICMRCKKESNTFDHFMDFMLDIKQNVMTLEKALEKFTQPELLQQDNCYKCPKCKMKVEAQKRFSVFRAPTVATFQLKRFDYNRTFGGKITKQICYPEKLNLRPYMSENKGEPVWYHLNAVLVHSGPSCNAGHYYCYVKNSNGFWYIMDDQRVHQVSLNQVLNQSAYVLFYIKIDNAERIPLKKCVENKSSFTKGVISNNHSAKSPEMNNMKSMPLREKSPFENSNQQLNSPDVVKKINNISTPSREKVSFGFQPGLTSSAYVSPKNKINSSVFTKSVPLTPVSSKQGGLVPYIEDSSESSDASESVSSVNKINCILNGDVKTSIRNSSLDSFSLSSYKKNDVLENELKTISKNGSIDNYSSSSRLEIKAKLSKSVLNSCPSSLIRNTVPKVSVSKNWIVTEASDTASSSSSTGGGSAKSDWRVTVIDDIIDSPRTTEKKGFDIKATDFAKSTLEKPILSHVVVTKENDTDKLSNKIEFENNSSAQNCNFRTQQNNFVNESKEPVQNNFKRKHDNSYSKVSERCSHAEHNENRHSPVPKKVKHSEKSPFLMPGIKDSQISHKYNNVENSTLLQRQYSASNYDGTRTNLTSLSNANSEQTCKNSFNSSSMDRRKINCLKKEGLHIKGKYKEKNGFTESSKSSQYDGKNISISNQDKDTSLYGIEIPTWRSENNYRSSIVPSHEHRRSFDHYDEEIDRGKIRKSKMKDPHQYFRRKNPFQKHADRYHYKYNGKCHHNHHSQRKPYSSHYNNSWKPKYNDGYHRYKNHHQRHHC